MRWRTGMDLDLAGLLGFVDNGLEVVGELPLGLARRVAGLGAAGFGFLAEEEDVLRLAPEVELLAVNHAITRGAVFGPALDILGCGVGD